MKTRKIESFEHSDNLVNGINFLNSSIIPSDYQANFAEIPTAYQLYWEAYQEQEAFLAKGKPTEADFLATQENPFENAVIASPEQIEKLWGGQA